VRFVALEVILDQPQNERRPGNERIELKQEDAILAFLPHGIFPFAFGVGALTEAGQAIFGPFRPIIASAAKKVPVLTEIIAWLHGLDASRSTVDRALSRGDRVGVVPGGISEMFAGFPKPECHPDEEIAIVRKGFLRMALQHQRPVVPIYCFGATKMFRRWQLPALESLSNLLRMSLIVFYGVGGLPIPFRQRLTYVVGDPVVPPPLMGQDEAQVEALHQQFCQELQRLFERHKEAYGWGHKTLQLLSK
jgi:2-acylglycerol O-acyltransferase 2